MISSYRIFVFLIDKDVSRTEIKGANFKFYSYQQL